MDLELEKRTLRRVSWRIVPFIMLLYFIAYLDRVNIGFAALTMKQDLGFSASILGFGAGIFFWGYFMFEVPSNIILHKVGARLWIARVMVTWGIISAAMAFATECFSRVLSWLNRPMTTRRVSSKALPPMFRGAT